MEQLIADFHIHTKYSLEPIMLGIFKTTPLYGPEQLIKHAIKKKLDVIAITDHDTIKGAKLGEKLIKKSGSNLILIKGEEVSTKDGHLIGLGLEENIKPGLSAEETIDKIKKQGGISIAPHPFTAYGLGKKILNLKLNAVETKNLWAMFLNQNGKANRHATKLNLAKVGSSDAHSLSAVGKVYTKVTSKQRNVDAVLNAIKQRKTVPGSRITPHGALWTLIKGTCLTLRVWQ